MLIIGGGPGGSATALALKKSGLRVAIIDKSTFPRDKVCGELIHRRGIRTLGELDPELEQAFRTFPKTAILKYTRAHFKGQSILFKWVNESYTCPRMSLDKFLLDWVKDHTNTQVFTGITPNKITIDDDGVTVTIKDSDIVFKGKMIIGADGAQSTVGKQLTVKVMDKEHYLGSVRAYYSGIKDIQEEVSEVFFNTKFNLNYFWVFPERDGLANVGFGMLASDISQNKVNLKDTFYQYFKETPELGARFAEAKAEGPLEGFGVPLGSNANVITSGERFMLIGDAASLSNPLSGTGIGNAIVSGKLAAQQVERCFSNNDFSKEAMKEYDAILKRAIIDELTASFKAQKMLGKMPFMLHVVFFAAKFPRVKKMIQKFV